MLEAALQDADPKFEQRLTPRRHIRLPALKPRWHLTLAIGMIVLGLAVIVATFAVSLPAATMGILTAGLGMGWAVSAVRSQTRHRLRRRE